MVADYTGNQLTWTWLKSPMIRTWQCLTSRKALLDWFLFGMDSLFLYLFSFCDCNHIQWWLSWYPLVPLLQGVALCCCCWSLQTWTRSMRRRMCQNMHVKFYLFGKLSQTHFNLPGPDSSTFPSHQMPFRGAFNFDNVARRRGGEFWGYTVELSRSRKAAQGCPLF